MDRGKTVTGVFGGMKMDLEKDVEKQLVTGTKKRGGRAYKFVSPGNAGVPDRIVILPDGRLYFVELKREDGKLTQNQVRQIRRLTTLGQQVTVCYGRDGVEKFFKGVDGRRVNHGR